MTGLLDGISLAEDIQDFAENMSSGHEVIGLLSLAGAGGAVKDVLTDPVGAIAAAGFGWLFEHVPVLTSALNAVSGNPDAIDATCDTWRDQVAVPMQAVSNSLKEAAEGTESGWTGDPADAYRAATGGLAEHSKAMGMAADAVAVSLRLAGSLVIEVRNYIRDELSKLLGWLVGAAAIAAASAVPTAGSSVAAFTSTAIMRGASLGQKFAAMLRTLVSRIEKLASNLGKLGEMTDMLRKSATKLDGAATAAAEVGNTGTGINRAIIALADKSANAVPGIPGREDLFKEAGKGSVKALGDVWKTGTVTAPPRESSA